MLEIEFKVMQNFLLLFATNRDRSIIEGGATYICGGWGLGVVLKAHANFSP